MTALDELLATYAKIQQQRAIGMTERLARLQQQLASQLLTIREQERQFIAQQEQVLREIRPMLALDARSLLGTDEFEQFRRSLLQDIDAAGIKQTFPIEILPHPTAWRLNQQPVPLQIHEIEALQTNDVIGSGVRLRAGLGAWQQGRLIPMEIEQSWLLIVQQLQGKIQNTGFSPDSAQALVQEMMCLFAYIAALFWIDPVADQFLGRNRMSSD